MLGSLEALFAATVTFVAGHFILSSAPVRSALVRRFGEGTFLGVYSLIVAAVFVWLLLAFASAPFSLLWAAPRTLAWLPVIVMPVACILVVCGLTAPNPTMAGAQFRDQPPPISGIITITRHPFLWGTGLWALCHLPINGEAAPFILFAGIAALSFGGMFHIDQRKAATLGAGWGPIALTTSVLPFAAAATSRTKIDWRGIGWPRLVGGLALYLVLVGVHPLVIGVPAHP